MPRWTFCDSFLGVSLQWCIVITGSRPLQISLTAPRLRDSLPQLAHWPCCMRGSMGAKWAWENLPVQCTSVKSKTEHVQTLDYTRLAFVWFYRGDYSSLNQNSDTSVIQSSLMRFMSVCMFILLHKENEIKRMNPSSEPGLQLSLHFEASTSVIPIGTGFENKSTFVPLWKSQQTSLKYIFTYF